MNYSKLFVGLFFTLFLLLGCKSESDKSDSPAPTPKNVNVPAFNADSAYSFVEQQVNFGYRIPGTSEHLACKNWLVGQMEHYGARVKVQEFKASFQNIKDADAFNIIGQINPEKSRRILLAAHWDSRSRSDHDLDEANHNKPVLGADDAGSGVAVLLEIARIINENPIDLGIDIIFFDAEDQGDSGDACQISCSWSLGSQYWSRNIYPKNYKPEYGILLDMVGAKNASFYKEGISMSYASEQTNKIWTLAQRMGYSDFFIDKRTSSIIDDHVFVNTIARIPMLDIINMKPESGDQMFQKCWHTQCDDMSGIDKRTLRVVGQVVSAVLYKESGNSL